jgi:hypothetical protein
VLDGSSSRVVGVMVCVFSLGARTSNFAHLFSQQSATWFDRLITGWIITTRVVMTTMH